MPSYEGQPSIYLEGLASGVDLSAATNANKFVKYVNTGAVEFTYVDGGVGVNDTITRAAGSFVTDGIRAGDKVTVQGTASNDGVYEVESVAALTLTLTEDAELTSETISSTIIANQRVVLCAADSDLPCGVLKNLPKAGEGADVMAFGITTVQADEALVSGNRVSTSGDGQAAVCIAAKYVVGQVVSGASGAGKLATIAINCLNPSLRAA